MKQQNYFKRFFLVFSVLCLLVVPLSAVFPSISDITIYDGVIRLHILANSDSEIDQSVKLSVRDEILSVVGELLDGITDRQTAEQLLSENLTLFESAAAKILNEKGFSYSPHAALTKEIYPTREYGGFSLPAGEYTSLKIMLGDANGQNWWCVLFPSMCTQYGTKTNLSDNELIEAGLTPSQIKLITGNSNEVKIKFRIVELISKLFS